MGRPDHIYPARHIGRFSAVAIVLMTIMTDAGVAQTPYASRGGVLGAMIVKFERCGIGPYVVMDEFWRRLEKNKATPAERASWLLAIAAGKDRARATAFDGDCRYMDRLRRAIPLVMSDQSLPPY